MKQFSTTAFALSLLIVVSGCQDDNSPEPMTDPVVATKKLDYYEDLYDVSGLEFQPQLRVQYTYDDSGGKLAKYTISSFNPEEDTLQELSYYTFSYSQGLVSEIKGFISSTDQLSISHSYIYAEDSTLLSISEINPLAGVNSTASFTYSENKDTVNVSYVYSNGNSSDYLFSNVNGNIASERTSRGSEICNNGTYTYDDHINPLNSLGFVDFSLLNYSKNNKLSEEVEYLNCAFPSIIPDTYEYTYDEDGYPILLETTYKGESPLKTIRRFVYLED